MIQYMKFQLGCLLVVIYIGIGYWVETRKKKGGAEVECNPIFDFILFLSPWAIIFDGLTAWTVNCLATIPLWVNDLLHFLFMNLMNFVTVAIYLYFYNLTLGIPKEPIKRIFMFLPCALSTLVIIGFFGELSYVEGVHTNYSMGISAIACYVSVMYHYGYIMYLFLRHRRSIERGKRKSVLGFILLCGVCLALQVLFRELLISAIYPTMMVLGIYLHFENPAIIRINKNNQEMVSAFAAMVESRDGSTGGHIKRTREYVIILLTEMRKKEKYHEMICQDYMNCMQEAAPLHDVGKMATPDDILLKPGKLTDKEFEIMKEHSTKGGELIEKLLGNMKNPLFEQIAYEVAKYHHEKWNGKGYPEGLKGEEIPLHARVMAIADVFDAISEERCYRPAMPLDKCFSIIEEGAGKDFDPELVAIFLAARKQIEQKHFSVNMELER